MTRDSRRCLAAAFAAALLACGGEREAPQSAPGAAPAPAASEEAGAASGAAVVAPSAPSPAAGPAPTRAELAEATYPGLFDEPVTLHEGRFEGEPFEPGGASRPTAQLVEDFLLTGDLDGDGSEESVALVSTSSGGSGTPLFLVLAGRSGGEITIRGTALVGDRVQVRSARLENSAISLDVVQAGPDDAACCPSQKATRAFAAGPQGLRETGATVTGTLSVADLGGVEWVLQSLAADEPAPTEPTVTLSFQGSRASGFDGCNRYFGELEETAPGQIRFGPLGATRRACEEAAMDLEQRYLAALGAVTRYAFLAGRLALTVPREGGVDTLLFVSRKPVPLDPEPEQP